MATPKIDKTTLRKLLFEYEKGSVKNGADIAKVIETDNMSTIKAYASQLKAVVKRKKELEADNKPITNTVTTSKSASKSASKPASKPVTNTVTTSKPVDTTIGKDDSVLLRSLLNKRTVLVTLPNGSAEPFVVKNVSPQAVMFVPKPKAAPNDTSQVKELTVLGVSKHISFDQLEEIGDDSAAFMPGVSVGEMKVLWKLA